MKVAAAWLERCYVEITTLNPSSTIIPLQRARHLPYASDWKHPPISHHDFSNEWDFHTLLIPPSPPLSSPPSRELFGIFPLFLFNFFSFPKTFNE